MLQPPNPFTIGDEGTVRFYIPQAMVDCDVSVKIIGILGDYVVIEVIDPQLKGFAFTYRIDERDARNGYLIGSTVVKGIETPPIPASWVSKL